MNQERHWKPSRGIKENELNLQNGFCIRREKMEDEGLGPSRIRSVSSFASFVEVLSGN